MNGTGNSCDAVVRPLLTEADEAPVVIEFWSEKKPLLVWKLDSDPESFDEIDIFGCRWKMKAPDWKFLMCVGIFKCVIFKGLITATDVRTTNPNTHGPLFHESDAQMHLPRDGNLIRLQFCLADLAPSASLFYMMNSSDKTLRTIFLDALQGQEAQSTDAKPTEFFRFET